MDFPFVLLLLVPLGATLLAMPLARYVGAKLGLLDHPEERKMQRIAIPRTGGIGLLVGLTAGTVLLAQLAGSLGIHLSRELIALFAGAVLIHLTGVLDDLLDLPAKKKLLGQAVAVGIVVSQGVVIDVVTIPGGPTLELGLLAVPFTMFFLLGFINAINLVDGLDGLASGIVGVGSLTLAIFGLLDGNYVLAALATIVLGSVLGFLPYNFVKRKTFLGDAGSMLLGYLLGVVAITGAWFTQESTPILVVLACAIVPILDVATTILRRFRKGQAIFRPDSMHIHHRLVRFGLSPRRTVTTIVAITFYCSTQALVLFVDGAQTLVITSSAAMLFVFVQMRNQRLRNLTETNATLREIIFYLLGAQDGRGPYMSGDLAISDVLAMARREPRPQPAMVRASAREVAVAAD